MAKQILVLLIGILGAACAEAQEVPKYTFNFGAGFVEPVYGVGHFTDVGWNIGGGAGYNVNQWLSVPLDINYNQLGINSTTLFNLGAPGGRVGIWTFTVDPVVHLTRKRRVDIYLTGGGGLFRREDTLSAPVPVFGGFGYFGSYGGFMNQTLASYSVNKPGWDGGAGVNFGSNWRVKFYAEARYERMYTANGLTNFVPVTFGVRF